MEKIIADDKRVCVCAQREGPETWTGLAGVSCQCCSFYMTQEEMAPDRQLSW